eukprot:747876-Hanusia_phi.AAC.1
MMEGRRVSIETQQLRAWLSAGFPAIFPPPNHDEQWRQLGLWSVILAAGVGLLSVLVARKKSLGSAKKDVSDPNRPAAQESSRQRPGRNEKEDNLFEQDDRPQSIPDDFDEDDDEWEVSPLSPRLVYPPGSRLCRKRSRRPQTQGKVIGNETMGVLDRLLVKLFLSFSAMINRTNGLRGLR